MHPNEKARRRDPRIYTYEPLPCPFDKKVSVKPAWQCACCGTCARVPVPSVHLCSGGFQRWKEPRHRTICSRLSVKACNGLGPSRFDSVSWSYLAAGCVDAELLCSWRYCVSACCCVSCRVPTAPMGTPARTPTTCMSTGGSPRVGLCAVVGAGMWLSLACGLLVPASVHVRVLLPTRWYQTLC